MPALLLSTLALVAVAVLWLAARYLFQGLDGRANAADERLRKLESALAPRPVVVPGRTGFVPPDSEPITEPIPEHSRPSQVAAFRKA